MTLYLKDAQFIDYQSFAVSSTNLLVEPGPDGSISLLDNIPGTDALGNGDRIIDCKGKCVTKSFGCGHHHIYSTLARGMPPPHSIPTNFMEILEYVWWHIDKRLDLGMIEASALVTALYCAKNGVTFVIDHHSSPHAVKDSLPTIAAAFDKVGISHLLCYELSDRDGRVSRDRGLEETEDYLKKGKQGLVGLHASFTVGDDLLEKAVVLAKRYDSGIHVHAAEDNIDQEDCIKNYGKRVIERFAAAGVLELRKSILAHCLHLNEKEWEILSGSQACVVQNIESNLNNNVGFFNPKIKMTNLLLGTDGMHSDMLRSAKIAFLIGQQAEKISPAHIYGRFRKIHEYTKSNGFAGDGENNLAILAYDSPTEIDADNFLSHFIYGIESNHVESVISDGKLIMKNRKIVTVDEEEILSFSKENAKRLWERLRIP